MRRALLLGTLLGGAACSGLAGLDKDFVVDDSTSVPPDGGGIDATGTPPRDGGEPVDAAVDAPLGPFCPDGGALFCTDFETAPSIAAEWTRTEKTGGDPMLLPAIGLRGSRALDAKMTAAGAGTAATVAWRTVGNGFPVNQTITLTFSFNVKAKLTNYAAIGVIQVGGIEHGLAMYDASKCVLGPSCLDENDQTGRGHDLGNTKVLELNAWHTGIVSVTRTATGFAGKVIVDGTSVDDRTTGALPATAANGSPTVEVGVGSFFSSGAGTNDVVIDDVLVTN